MSSSAADATSETAKKLALPQETHLGGVIGNAVADEAGPAHIKPCLA
jgi:hypothetical protein